MANHRKQWNKLNEPIKLTCRVGGSYSFHQPFLSDGTVIRDTGKARLIRGQDFKDRTVEVWVPDFFIKNVIGTIKWTSLQFDTLRRDELIDRMNEYLNKHKKE